MRGFEEVQLEGGAWGYINWQRLASLVIATAPGSSVVSGERSKQRGVMSEDSVAWR